MKGFIAPKFTKEDVRQLLTDEDYKTILELMGYKVVPKNKKVSKNCWRINVWWKQYATTPWK